MLFSVFWAVRAPLSTKSSMRILRARAHPREVFAGRAPLIWSFNFVNTAVSDLPGLVFQKSGTQLKSLQRHQIL
jgi:hypothetical protein